MIDESRIKAQVISLLNANERDATDARLYSVNSSDPGFIGEEIDTAILYAQLAVMEAICGTDGHPLRKDFISNVAAANNAPLPIHYGTPGVPTITPFPGATKLKQGTRKSVEDVSAYRENPIAIGQAKLYDDLDHNESGLTGDASPLSGYYAIVEGMFYFTGYSATIPLANFTDSDTDKIPESKEPAIVAIALGNLAKDGTISDKFAYWEGIGQMELNFIRTGQMSQPSIKPTIGTRDRGTK